MPIIFFTHFTVTSFLISQVYYRKVLELPVVIKRFFLSNGSLKSILGLPFHIFFIIAFIHAAATKKIFDSSIWEIHYRYWLKLLRLRLYYIENFLWKCDYFTQTFCFALRIFFRQFLLLQFLYLFHLWGNFFCFQLIFLLHR